MEEENKHPSLEGKVRRAVKEIEGQEKGQWMPSEISPKVKAGLYIAGAFVLVWASQYVFSALAGAIRSFKNLRRSIREK